MKSQDFRDFGGPWRLKHLGFYTNDLKFVDLIPVKSLLQSYRTVP